MGNMRWIIIIVMIFFVVGCASETSESVIQLSNLQPLPDKSETDVIPLRVSVAAVISPEGTAESYQPLIDYLSLRLERPVELVQRRTYAETNQLLEERYVDLAFVCTSAYISGRDEFGMELLVAPQVNGESVYQSLLIVPADSTATSMEDLQGAVFAFTDPTSFSGRIYPTYLVMQLGSTPQEFFARTFFTYSHDSAIHAVAEALADGAAVDSLVYEFAIQREPSLAQKIKIIHQSPAFAIPPVVVSPNIRPQLRATLQAVLLEMDSDPAGQQALAALGIERFIMIEDSDYRTIREIVQAVGTLAP